MPQSYPDSFIYVRYTNAICIILEIATPALNTVAHCVSRGLNLTKKCNLSKHDCDIKGS